MNTLFKIIISQKTQENLPIMKFVIIIKENMLIKKILCMR